MKCPNCCSPMLVTDETANPKSHVTFYRCSLCSGEHVSSQATAATIIIAENRHPADLPMLRDYRPLPI